MRMTVNQNRRWHRWFAWYPVQVGLQWVWLEMVWRRGRYTDLAGKTVRWDYEHAMERPSGEFISP